VPAMALGACKWRQTSSVAQGNRLARPDLQGGLPRAGGHGLQRWPEKIAERGCRKATPFGAGNRPTHGCGV